jgi:hypothetical protein
VCIVKCNPIHKSFFLKYLSWIVGVLAPPLPSTGSSCTGISRSELLDPLLVDPCFTTDIRRTLLGDFGDVDDFGDIDLSSDTSGARGIPSKF